jgi:hypothetical protein
VPVRVETEAGPEDFRVDLAQAEQSFSFTVQSRPLAVSVDPDYHLFRRLDDAEIEATLSLVLADPAPTFVLEEGLDAALAQAYRDFAAAFVEGEPRIVSAAALADSARTVIWLGQQPPPFQEAPAGLELTPMFTLFQGERFDAGGYALVYTGKRGADGGFMAVLSQSAGEVAAIASKVPHYGKYSYLAFAGGANRLKGNWPATAGPLYRRLTAPGAGG